MTELYRIKAQMLCSGVVRAEYLTEPMTLDAIRKQFDKDTISPANSKWETIVEEGREWDMKYVCELVLNNSC